MTARERRDDADDRHAEHGDAGRDSRQDYQDHLAQHQADHSLSPGAQSHANPDFAGAAGDDESQNAVESDHR